jgi:hypothetical protein
MAERIASALVVSPARSRSAARGASRAVRALPESHDHDDRDFGNVSKRWRNSFLGPKMQE